MATKLNQPAVATQKYYFRIKRFFDLIASFSLLFLLSPLLITIWVLVKLDSKGPALYWSQRVGRNGVEFNMPKFRTMRINTPEVSSDLLSEPNAHITRVGSWLRVFSLDELPQLWSVLCGKMSIVGPRPALHTQAILVKSRQRYGIHKLLPGITGWAQINGRDYNRDSQKLALDGEYLENYCLAVDMQILARTVVLVLKRKDVSH